MLDPVAYLFAEGLLFDLGGGEDIVGLVSGEDVGGGTHIEKLDVVRIKAQRGGVGPEVVDVLFEIHEQCRLAGGDTGREEMEPENRLAGTGRATNHVVTLRHQSPV
jgi:hypothetical protein